MRILLAEDEKSLARALVTLLKKHHYEADAVYDGAEALAYLQTGNYDAAILDIMMPGMDGIEVLCRARESGISVPILMLTAKSDVRDKVNGLDSGANDYMTKPFSAQELLARIRAMTRAQHLRAFHARGQLPADRQGISDDGDAPFQPAPADSHRAVPGEDLGL